MSRYIDVDEEIEKIDEVLYIMRELGYDENDIPFHSRMLFKNALSKAPTADVVAVKHGHWVKDTYCSICDYDKSDRLFDVNPPYCCMCGAKMDMPIFLTKKLNIKGYDDEIGLPPAFCGAE